jgi:hypothetical protein
LWIASPGECTPPCVLPPGLQLPAARSVNLNRSLRCTPMLTCSSASTTDHREGAAGVGKGSRSQEWDAVQTVPYNDVPRHCTLTPVSRSCTRVPLSHRSHRSQLLRPMPHKRFPIKGTLQKCALICSPAKFLHAEISAILRFRALTSEV